MTEPANVVMMRQLLIFLKYPTSGRVKTRLAATIGPRAARDVYRACAEVTLREAQAWRREAVVCVDPPGAIERTRAWIGPGWTLEPQRGRTLGARLAEATGRAFGRGATRVVVIGTDAPWLRAEDVGAAFRSLERSGLVIGPAEDGGYYLIGLARASPRIFEGVSWSTSAVYAQTLANARRLGLLVHVLPRGYDIDREEDLRRFLSDARASGHHAEAFAAIEQSLKGRNALCLS